MNKENMNVLVNIIGAVESGGQVYGRRNYSAYAAPYTNSMVEHTITLGWAQNYGDEARRLIQMIYDKMGDEEFSKIDKNGSIKNMLSHDWVKEGWKPSDAQKKTLIALISSSIGRACQDELFASLMESFISECSKLYTSDVKALMMYCEIRHLGGAGPVKRIFNRCNGNYSLDSIMASLKKDQNDTSNDNQVGDKKFWTRHEKCREFIDKYAVSEGKTTQNTTQAKTGTGTGITASTVINKAKSFLGYNEADGTHKKIIDIYNSFIPHARGYAVQYNDQWCDTFVSSVFIALKAIDLIGGTECGVEEHVKLFKAAGIWKEDGTIVPKPGYIIVYSWRTTSQPNDAYSDHIGIVEKVTGKTITVIEGNYKDSVGRREIPVGWGYIRGYAVPKYADETASTPVQTPAKAPTQPKAATATPKTLSKTRKFVGKVKANKLNVRSWAGTEYPNIKAYPILAFGNLIDVCDSVKAKDGTVWYYIRIGKSVYGFVYSIYIERV